MTAPVSETFDASAWKDVPGFADLTDVTYHRALDHGTVRIAFNRPEVRNAFRPHTVDEVRVVDATRRCVAAEGTVDRRPLVQATSAIATSAVRAKATDHAREVAAFLSVRDDWPRFARIGTPLRAQRIRRRCTAADRRCR